MSRQLLAALCRLAIAAFAVAVAVTLTPFPVAAQVTTATTTTPAIPTECTRTAIDSFGQTALNNLNFAAGDDGTTTNYTIAGHALSFLPKADGSSYVYENLNCLPSTNNRFIVFTLQTNSTIRFVVQLQTGCGAAELRINGPLIMGTFPQATTFAVDSQSYLSLSATTNLWSFVLTQMDTLSGTAPWNFTDLLAASTLPCGYANITLVTQGDVTPNWTNSAAESACKRIAVDSFTVGGANNLGALASDDRTMTTYTVGGGQATMVPAKNGNSYWYEDVTIGNKSLNVAAVPDLVFSVQTGAPGGSVQLNIEYGSIGSSSRLTLATLTPGATAKTYVIPLANYLTATQLQSVVSFSWISFTTDGTSSWIFKGVSLVSNYTTCGVMTPTLVPGLPSGCTRLSVDTLKLFLWTVLITVLVSST
ncbi:hypothetical protein HDU86_000532 [Geranomyces michiganensis]|nr:hypothetical protein HDU86_000532 [Geranomyces michiganensis]